MIPNCSTKYDDRCGNNNNSDNSNVSRTIANERSQLFRSYTSGHALRRRSNARAIILHFTYSVLLKYCA